jgi:hypothetical protein
MLRFDVGWTNAVSNVYNTPAESAWPAMRFLSMAGQFFVPLAEMHFAAMRAVLLSLANTFISHSHPPIDSATA